MLALLLMAALLTACGKADVPAAAPSSGELDLSTVKTIGDILNSNAEVLQSGSVNDVFIYAFKSGDAVYRAIAEMPQDIMDAYYDLDWSDPDLEAKQNALLAPLEIRKIEDLNEMAMDEADVNAYIGKTGAELLDNGFTVYFWNLETMEFGMNRGVAAYKVFFDSKVDEEDWDSFSEEDIRDMTIKEMTFEGVGDATWYEP
jgi:hypothetical protein